ncbi:unnamed protein product [Phaedon cochleariae]|uniref:Phospholipase A2 n=1 Tax=Phaedon cochleariae TaxID=80249 RepID=A0A9P0GIZ2_PHACE|nr:unnamed protein product [Phaedon cochleariae]
MNDYEYSNQICDIIFVFIYRESQENTEFHFSKCSVDGLKITWNDSIDQDFEYKVSHGKTTEMVEMCMPNRQFIYPGTKWCGQGNIADDYDDLGVYRDTDKCCRAHDKCPDTIEAYQTEHNLTNPAFYTRLSCECDMEFYRCLKSVNDFSSNQMGTIYFVALGTQCFKEDYPVTGCTEYTYFPFRKCLQYTFDETQEKHYQWFDLPNY